MKKKITNLSIADSSTPLLQSNLPDALSGEQDLRLQAEAKWRERKKKSAPPPATEPDSRRLFHELEVHQIELEMQNEELMQSRAQAEAAVRQYADLYNLAPVGYLTLARDGRILKINQAGADLLGMEHGARILHRLSTFVPIESRPVYNVFF